MATYRVFVTRHYIAVDFYDIEANSAKDAERAARKAAKKLIPDARAEAVDNGWIPDEAGEIAYLGSSAAPFEVEEVYRDNRAIVYHDKG